MITILDYTTKIPLQMIGDLAGVCTKADRTRSEANIKRAISCFISEHGRTEELPEVYCIIEGYSARCLRELYTHIGGSPTRLQESTRYVNCSDFKYYTGTTINTPEKKEAYDKCMNDIAKAYDNLIETGVSKEDAANVLPLGMMSTMVWKVGLRTLINFFNVRLCNRAYKEIRDLAQELKTCLFNYSEEWNYIASKYFVPKCVARHYCSETRSCGYYKNLEKDK